MEPVLIKAYINHGESHGTDTEKAEKIPGGVFMIGSPETEDGHYDDEDPLHEVHAPSFYMGRYPVCDQ